MDSELCANYSSYTCSDENFGIGLGFLKVRFLSVAFGSVVYACRLYEFKLFVSCFCLVNHSPPTHFCILNHLPFVVVHNSYLSSYGMEGKLVLRTPSD